LEKTERKLMHNSVIESLRAYRRARRKQQMNLERDARLVKWIKEKRNQGLEETYLTAMAYIFTCVIKFGFSTYAASDFIMRPSFGSFMFWPALGMATRRSSQIWRLSFFDFLRKGERGERGERGDVKLCDVCDEWREIGWVR
jgi:hypothetical protein